MKKIVVTYSDPNYSWSITVDPEEEREFLKELQENGANPHLENMTLENIWRPIRSHIKDLHRFNTRDEDHHSIFGFDECMWQTDTLRPNYKFDFDNLWVEVTWED